MSRKRREKRMVLAVSLLAIAAVLAAALAGRYRIEESWQLRRLQSGDAEVQLSAARRLIELQSLKGVGPIIATFADRGDFAELFSEIATNYGGRARAGIPALEALFDHPQARIHSRAIESLAKPQLRCEAAARALASGLRQPHLTSSNRLEALRALDGFGALARPAIPEIADCLSEPRTESLARTILLRLGGPPLLAREFARGLNSEDSRVRLLALDRLKELGKGARKEFAPIARRLNDETKGVSLRALETLEALDVRPALVAPLVEPTLSSDQVEVRRFGASILDAVPEEALRSLDALESAVADPDETVRAHAIRAIGNLGPRASRSIETLVEQLGSFGPDKPYAADALARIGAPAVPFLIDALKTDRAAHASVALAKLGPPAATAAVPALAQAIGTRRGSGQRHVFLALAACGPSARAAIPDLVAMVGQTGSPVAKQAARALAHIGEPAAEQLIEIARKDGPSAINALYGLGLLGPKAGEAVPVLIDKLERGDRNARLFAVGALGRLGAPGHAGVPALVRATKRGDHNAADALAELGPHATAALPELLGFLESKNPRLTWARMKAARAVWRIGGPLPPVVSALSEIIDGSAGGHCFRALQIVEEMGPAAAGTADAISGALRREDDSVLWAAAKALQRLGPAGAPAVPALIEAVQEPARRDDVIRALGSIGPDAAAAIPQLVRLLPTRSGDSRLAAIALGQMGPAAADAVPTLIANLDWTGRYGAEALGSIGPAAAKARPALREVISRAEKKLHISRPRGASPFVAAAAAALWRIGPSDEEWIRTIVRELENHNQPTFSLDQQSGKRTDRFPDCAQVARILGELGPAARAAVPSLEETLELRHDPELRLAAVLALHRITEEADRVVPTLIELLEPRCDFLRGAPARALGDLGPAATAAAPALIAAVTRNSIASRFYRRYLPRSSGPEDQHPQAAAARALGRLGLRSQPVLDTLNEALQCPMPDVRKAAAEALRELEAAQ